MAKSPFHQYFLDRHASMIEHAGYQLPEHFGDPQREHLHTRSVGSIFDLTHYGRLKISGRHARRLLDRVCTPRIADQPLLRCIQAPICNEQGGLIDRVLLWRFDNHWIMITDPQRRQIVHDHLKAHTQDLVVTIEDTTAGTAMVALQGPKVMEHVGRMSKEVPTLVQGQFCIKNLLIMKLFIARVSLTGDDGIVVILPALTATMALKLLAKEGADTAGNLMPAGLLAMESLRIEAGLPRTGFELDAAIDPFSLGLAGEIALTKDQAELGEPFVGQAALQRIATGAPPSQFIGLTMETQAKIATGGVISSAGQVIGKITSSAHSPTLQKMCGLGLVTQQVSPGQKLEVSVAGQSVEAQCVMLPMKG